MAMDGGRFAPSIGAMALRTTLTISFALFSIACDPGSDRAVDGGRPPPGDGGGGTLTCPELFDCIAACPDGDAGCVDRCIARGTPDAVTKANALAACADAAGCADEACITTNCGPEVTACAGSVPPIDGGVSTGTAPIRIEGTVRDTTTLLGLDSSGTVRFVRDDAEGMAVGLLAPGAAFYRLEQADYTAAQMLDSGCTYTGSEMVSFTNPPAFDNNFVYYPATSEYTFSTLLRRTFPGALTIACPPSTGVRYEDFSAELNMSSGTSLPISDGTTFRGTATISGVDRTWTWDLTGT